MNGSDFRMKTVGPVCFETVGRCVSSQWNEGRACDRSPDAVQRQTDELRQITVRQETDLSKLSKLQSGVDMAYRTREGSVSSMTNPSKIVLI